MKPELHTLEDTILLKKENIEEEDKKNLINIKYISLKWLKKFIFSFTGISFISLFFLNNHVSFEQQIKFVSTREFSGSLCILFALFMTLSILNDIINTAKQGEILSQKFYSIWLPIKISMISALLLPIDGNTSFVTQIIIEIIKLLNKLL